MYNKCIEKYQDNVQIIHNSYTIKEDLHSYRFEKAMKGFQSLLKLISDYINFLSEDMNVLEKLSMILNELFTIQEKLDYIRMADIIEYNIVPFFMERMEELLEDEDVKKNLLILRKIYQEENIKYLEEQGTEEQKQLIEILHDESLNSIDLIYSKSGHPNLKLVNRNKEFYLHSTVIPIGEAKGSMTQYNSLDVERYSVLGTGLGYHLWFLSNYTKKRIDAYEADRKVLRAIMETQRIEVMNNANIFIHYDKDYKSMTKELVSNLEGVVIHNPSLHNIENMEIAQCFQEYFLIKNSFENSKMLMKSNFLSNVNLIKKDIGELEPQFKNKTVYIVAAGPSLDKNINKLNAMVDENSIIIATGTVLKKLCEKKIRIDYGIFSDAKEELVNQIMGIENKEIPIILLSTACSQIAKNYKGDKYLAYQKGYEPAEKYAKERGLLTVQTGGSVSTCAMDVAITLGCKKIIFVGLDLAFTDNLAHAKNAGNTISQDINCLHQVSDFWNKGYVYSDDKFDLYRKWFVRRLKELRDDGSVIEVINATEGGSFIEGMIHMKL